MAEPPPIAAASPSVADIPAADWRELDRRHHLHPFSDPQRLARDGARVITRAAGVHLWDSDGQRLIDGMSGLWNVILGYGRRELVEAAARQLEILPYYNSFFATATPSMAALAAKLAALAPPGLEHVFFANSGSEANETAIRLARRYWALAGRPQKMAFIGLERGFHGSTLASASLGGIAHIHAQAGLPLPGFAHIPSPDLFRDGSGMAPEEFGILAARRLEERIAELGAENVAAFIGEPVQGAGGGVIPPANFWREVARICREHEVLLVLDELVTGFGRLGSWFGATHFGLRPDMIVLGKGITSGYQPLAATLVGDRIAAALIAQGGELHHGFTTSGHPVACAVALAAIAVLEREGLVARVATDIGPYFQDALSVLAEHPLVGEVRGIGLFAAIELVGDKERRRRFAPEGLAGSICRDVAMSQGLVMRAAGDTLLLAPPLVIRRDEVDALATHVRLALDTTAEALRRGNVPVAER
ncbi:MAG TPA: aminotransferase [Alphaproteobacteria bacterium]|nr:aminotransferase [Alphaproteobacteria bacterium]